MNGAVRADATGLVKLFATHSATFHLESLTPKDAAGLTSVNAMLAERLGPHLRWSWSSVSDEVAPFASDDFELVDGYPELLVDATIPLDDPGAHLLSRRFAASAYDSFGVAFHSAHERNRASPIQYRFYAELAPMTEASIYPTHAYLSFSVPLDWPVSEIAEMGRMVASSLRVRWGIVGLGFGAWEFDAQNSTRQALRAHARRHVGFDVGLDSGNMAVWHQYLRTVSWRTYVGPSLGNGLSTETLAALGLQVASLPNGTIEVQAGDRPRAGDVNRFDFPKEYTAADSGLRSLRCPGGVSFLTPWSEASTEAWLRRFERRVQ